MRAGWTFSCYRSGWAMGTQLAWEDELGRFFSVSGEVLCVINPEGLIQRASPAWTDALGFTPEELVSTSLPDLVHPDDRAEMLSGFEKLLKEGTGTITFECRLRRKDGSYCRLLWKAAAFPGTRSI